MHLLQDKDLMTKEKLAQVAFEYNSIYINEHSIDCALFAAGSVRNACLNREWEQLGELEKHGRI